MQFILGCGLLMPDAMGFLLVLVLCFLLLSQCPELCFQALCLLAFVQVIPFPCITPTETPGLANLFSSFMPCFDATSQERSFPSLACVSTYTLLLHSVFDFPFLTMTYMLVFS